MLEIESTAQRGCTIIGSGQNGNETVAGKTAFAGARNRCAYNYYPRESFREGLCFTGVRLSLCLSVITITK